MQRHPVARDLGACLVIAITIGLPGSDSRAGQPRDVPQSIVDGVAIFEFDETVTERLELRIGAQSDLLPASDTARMVFPLDPSSTVETRREEGAALALRTATLATCGAMVWERPEIRFVFTNLLIQATEARVVVRDADTNEILFLVASPAVELRSAGGRLALSGEMLLAAAAGRKYFDQPGDGGPIGLLSIEAWTQRGGAAFTDPACRGGDPQGDRAVANVSAVPGPDILVADLPDINRFGRVDDITAFGVATTACNVGTERADWFKLTNQHPVILQNLFRLKDNRFEQIGMAWIKHGFYAVSQSLCSPCLDPTVGTQLGVGCSDPYSASLNGQLTNMSPRADVNAHTGYFPYPWNGPNAASLVERRLQAHDADLEASLNVGARYFVEGHYVAAGDASAGTDDNNASYREVLVSETTPNTFQISVTSARPTQRGQAAVRAWKDVDPEVVETDVRVPGEGLFILAAKAAPLGDGTYRYAYTLQNLNSDRSARSFSLLLPIGAVVSGYGFHGPEYHSGEPYDNTPWTVTVTTEDITWSTDAYEINVNGSALRYATACTFWFDANVVPDPNKATIGLFKPGAPDTVSANTIGPKIALIDCNHNEVADACDVDCGYPACSSPCGASVDCDDNLMPDECQLDCNDNGIADACDVRDCPPEELACADCNDNTVPDGCESDCDADGLPDDCDPPGDTDADGVDDCHDACPLTTPAGACIPPQNQIVDCCFSSGLMFSMWTWQQCVEFCASDPDPAACGPVCDDPPTCPGTRCRATMCRDGCLIADFDGDGDIDARDFAALQVCFSGSSDGPGFRSPSAECAWMLNCDEDFDIDLHDYGTFQNLSTGP